MRQDGIVSIVCVAGIDPTALIDRSAGSGALYGQRNSAPSSRSFSDSGDLLSCSDLLLWTYLARAFRRRACSEHDAVS